MAARYASANICSTLNKLDIFKRVIDSFPPGIHMAFAYGSGVFQQEGNEMSNNMLDFILVVEESEKWHSENLKMNGKHYSSLSLFGPKFISDVQNNYGAGVYFNTLVPFEQRLIKYGVISISKLMQDLNFWETLYVSGRLHKPVRFVVSPVDNQLCESVTRNLTSALHAALLLLPEAFTESDLFIKITSLSYSGDFRMTFGEDKGKVWKIVHPNMSHFQELYGPVIGNEKNVHWNGSSGKFEQDVSRSTLLHHLNLLPEQVTRRIIASSPHLYEGKDTRTMYETVIETGDHKRIVAQGIADIVKKSSWSQSLKGTLTAGLVKSTKYSYSKVKKMFKGFSTTN